MIIELVKKINESESIAFISIYENQTTLHFIFLNDFVNIFVVKNIIVKLFNWKNLFDFSELFFQKCFYFWLRIPLWYFC